MADKKMLNLKSSIHIDDLVDRHVRVVFAGALVAGTKAVHAPTAQGIGVVGF